MFLASRELASTKPAFYLESLAELDVSLRLWSKVDIALYSCKLDASALLSLYYLLHFLKFVLIELLAHVVNYCISIIDKGVDKALSTLVSLHGGDSILGANELHGIGNFSSLEDLGVASSHLSVEDVVHDRVVEECRLLHDKTHGMSQLLEVVIPDVNTVDSDTPVIDIVES